MVFYILVNNIRKGPFSIEDLAKQNISAETLVWGIGFSNWKQAKDVPEISDILSCLPPDPPRSKPMPKTWLVESILVTCFCCLPFGIMGIINATKIDTCYQSGQYEEAEYRSRQAKRWTLGGFFTALALIVIYFLILLFSLLMSNL